MLLTSILKKLDNSSIYDVSESLIRNISDAMYQRVNIVYI